MNEKLSHGRRIIQRRNSPVYEVERPTGNAARSYLNYYIAQYRYSKRELGNASREKDKARIKVALKRVAAFRRMSLDLMLAIRIEQAKTAYERANNARIEDAVDCDSLKSALFNNFQSVHGRV